MIAGREMIRRRLAADHPAGGVDRRLGGCRPLAAGRCLGLSGQVVKRKTLDQAAVTRWRHVS
jgi:hypothetical protein